jgi:hypothetical protein
MKQFYEAEEELSKLWFALEIKAKLGFKLQAT